MRRQRIKKQISHVSRKFLGIIVTVATIIPFLFFVFERLGLTFFEATTILLLLVIIGMVSISILLYFSKKDQRPIALAGHAFISHDENLDHKDTYYYNIEKIWDLRENGRNITMIKRLHGYTTSDINNLTTAGHSKYGFSDENVKAYKKKGVNKKRVDWQPVSKKRRVSSIDDRLGGLGDWTKLDTKNNQGNKEYEGIYELLFNERKSKGSQFAIEVESPYGERNLKPEKFIFFTFFQYKRGIESVNCKVLLDTEPDDVIVTKISNSSDAAINAGVQHLDLNETKHPVDIKQHGDSILCSFTDSEPDPSVYVVNLRWDQ